VTERFFDSRANRDKLDQWLTRDPFEPYSGSGEEEVEEFELPEPDPVVWLLDYLLGIWTESLPVVRETLEEASAPEAVLAACDLLMRSRFSRDCDPVFEAVVIPPEQG
jgi:hypothetical protein